MSKISGSCSLVEEHLIIQAETVIPGSILQSLSIFVDVQITFYCHLLCFLVTLVCPQKLKPELSSKTYMARIVIIFQAQQLELFIYELICFYKSTDRSEIPHSCFCRHRSLSKIILCLGVAQVKLSVTCRVQQWFVMFLRGNIVYLVLFDIPIVKKNTKGFFVFQGNFMSSARSWYCQTMTMELLSGWLLALVSEFSGRPKACLVLV